MSIQFTKELFKQVLRRLTGSFSLLHSKAHAEYELQENFSSSSPDLSVLLVILMCPRLYTMDLLTSENHLLHR